MRDENVKKEEHTPGPLLMGDEETGFVLSLHKPDGTNYANVKLFGTRKECIETAKLTASAPKLKADIDHAVKCAKEYRPDYPWQLNTASEAVWALGQSATGIEKANDDLHKIINKLKADNEVLVGACREIMKGQGAYSMDQFEHARNTINNMKKIAKQALEQTKGES